MVNEMFGKRVVSECHDIILNKKIYFVINIKIINVTKGD